MDAGRAYSDSALHPAKEPGAFATAAPDNAGNTVSPNLQARPATRADIDQFYPQVTASFRAKVCELDGEAQGIIGFTLTLPCRTMFSVVREPLKPHIRSLTCLRLVKWAADELQRSALPVLAIAEPGEPEAPKILERLGFRWLGEFGGDVVFKFTPGETD